MSYKDIMVVTKDAMEDVADAIRTKTGGTDPIKVEDLDDAVDSIETGITPTGTIQLTQNGTGIDVTQYAAADVTVPNTYEAADEGKVVSSGALVAQTAKPDTITQNNTYDTTGYNSVTVNVPVPTYGFIVKCTYDLSDPDYMDDHTEWPNPVLSTDSELDNYSVNDYVILTGYASGAGGNTYFVAYGYITELVTGGIKFYCIGVRKPASLT